MWKIKRRERIGDEVGEEKREVDEVVEAVEE